jgi:hypothetical protein
MGQRNHPDLYREGEKIRVDARVPANDHATIH